MGVCFSAEIALCFEVEQPTAADRNAHEELEIVIAICWHCNSAIPCSFKIKYLAH